MGKLQIIQSKSCLRRAWHGGEGYRRIKAIVQDLRQFTRLDEAVAMQIPLVEPIRSTVKLIRTKFDRVVFELALEFNPVIACQPATLGQVFMNLIVNACEAITRHGEQQSGTVRITTSAQVQDGNPQVRVDIEDNGCGMDAVTLSKVFEPFFTTKGVGAGTGLGLAICHGIVEEHGGRIEVESTPGHGSRFTVVLPLRATWSRAR